MTRLDEMIQDAKAEKNFSLLRNLVALKNELFPPTTVTYYTQGETTTGPIMKLDVFENDEIGG